jgi:dTDP-4-amino-4,6-dideoxygalactose transaminase
LRVPFVDLRAQHLSIAGEVAEAWGGVLERCDFILGGEVAAFESELAAFCEVEHAVGVDSGTSAIELALRALGVGPGDEVITAANTFVATAFAISHIGAAPVLVDVDPGSLTLDPALLEAAITPRTRAIVPVHLYGQPADMDAVLAIAREHGLLVVEDACQAHGARHRGRRVGSMGDAGAFSFFPAKNLGGYGDGGAVVTDDPDVADALRRLRNYGQRRKHHHETLGFNRRLDTLQAAVLRIKLRRLDEWNARRRRHAAEYVRLLEGAGVGLPQAGNGVEHVWHLFVIQADDRDALAAGLAEAGIGTGIHYPIPVHRQAPYLARHGAAERFPVVEAAAGRILSLPMFPELEPAALAHAAAAVGALTRPRAGARPPAAAVG